MKRFLSLLGFFMIVLLFTIPAMAEERSVIGINFPSTVGAINYENESAHNNSWVLGGLVFLDSSNTNLWLSGGKRFYKGSENNRPYKGLYVNYMYDNQKGNPQPKWGTGADGVFGWEWRFGEKRNTRLFLELGLTSYYISDTDTDAGFHVTPVGGIGFGFNL